MKKLLIVGAGGHGKYLSFTIEPQALINANTEVGEGCIISVGAVIDHDVIIENAVHVNAGAIVKAGAVVPILTKLEAGEVVLGYESARVIR